MTRRIWSGSVAAITFGLAVGLAAQSQPTSQDTSAKNVTVTGCIERATASPTGTTGSTSAAPATRDAQFVLKNTASSASSSTPAAGAAPSTAVASEYRLDADDVKLTPHVGHKVEITGTVEPSTAAPESSAASKMSGPKLKVNNVRMIAPTCS